MPIRVTISFRLKRMAIMARKMYASLAWSPCTAISSQAKPTLVWYYCHVPSSVIIGSYLHSIVAHWALQDVEAMEEVFTKTALVDLLSSLPTQSAKAATAKVEYTKGPAMSCRTSPLLYALGKRVTSAQAKWLDALNLSHWVLCDIRADTATYKDFWRVLLEKRVRSKPLREKLTAIIHPKK